MWRRWGSNAVFGSLGVGVWKNIRKGLGDFPKFVRLKVRDGSKIKFWHNVWCGDQTLKAVSPFLFSIVCFKKALVANHVQFSNDSLH